MVMALYVKPPPIKAAISTESAKPMIKGHLTVVNGFIRFPLSKILRRGGLEE